MKKRKGKYIWLVMVLLITNNTFAHKTDVDSTIDESSNSFIFAPLINSNPVLKIGFGGLGMFFFKFDENDTQSPPSMVGLFGLYSTNKSYIFVPSARLFWNEDKNRATVATGLVNINNDFIYDIDENSVQLVFTENRKFLSLEYSRKIISDFYLGLIYLGTKTIYKFEEGTDEQNEFTLDFFEQNGITDNFVSSVGLNISFDNRDYVYYPKNGLMFSIRPKLNADWLGSDNDYVDTDYKFAYSIPIKSRNDLGFALAGGFAWGDVPFDGYQNYGIRNSLRGYQTGKYKGRNMVAFQAEYRWNFYKRWGTVFFADSGSYGETKIMEKKN